MLRPAPALLLLGVVLAGCAQPSAPRPAPALLMTRPDAQHVAATLTPAQAQARARWTLQPSPDCGAPAGPARSGDWPTSGPLVQEATRADLLTVTTADGVQVADCVPPAGDLSPTSAHP